MKKLFKRLNLCILFFSAVFIQMTAASCDIIGDKERNVLKANDIRISENPMKIPRELPEIFFYPGVDILKSGVYRSERFISAAEGVVIFQSDDPIFKIARFYNYEIKRSGWKIIQSLTNLNEHLLMVESPGIRYRRLVTIIMRGNSPTIIKIYFRKSDDS